MLVKNIRKHSNADREPEEKTDDTSRMLGRKTRCAYIDIIPTRKSILCSAFSISLFINSTVKCFLSIQSLSCLVKSILCEFLFKLIASKMFTVVDTRPPSAHTSVPTCWRWLFDWDRPSPTTTLCVR